MTDNTLCKNKTILLTGAAGSVGIPLARTLLGRKPRALILIDNNEGALYDLEQDLRSDKISTFIADIRDKERIEPLFEGVDLVFHLAALKNVPMCEYNPFEAVKTNIIGTQNVVDICLQENVQKVIFTSTGKAVKPTTMYGASKLFAERLLTIANSRDGENGTIFASVRFGNVLGSRGSIFPLFRKQIENGGPITITHVDMVRPNILMPNALKLIMKAQETARGGEVFIFKMKVMKIVEVAHVMIRELAPKYGYKPEEIGTTIIGIKPGEKMKEELVTESEQKRAFETEDLFIIAPEMEKLSYVQNFYRDLATRGDIKSYVPRDPVFLSEEEIKEVLHLLNYL